jgi:hypothetical protein
VLSIWLLALALIVVAVAVAIVPRLRERPQRGGDRSQDPSGPPTLGRDPDGPPAP